MKILVLIGAFGTLNLMISTLARAIPVSEIRSMIAESATGAIAVIGPNSELISFTRDATSEGENIKIRQCAEGTRKSEVESSKGCTLVDGTQELAVSQADFRQLFLGELAVIGQDPRDLTAEQKDLLVKSLSADPNEAADKAELANLQKQLDSLKAQQTDFGLSDEDVNISKVKDLGSKITSVKGKMDGYQNVLKAKHDVTDLLDKTVANTEGTNLKQTLKYSADKGGLAYNALKRMVSPNSGGGFVSVKDPVSGEVGKKDVRTGIIWFGTDKADAYWEEAMAYCIERKQILPSQADFILAEQHNLREVYPEMKRRDSNGYRRSFWSSTPVDRDGAYLFGGYEGNAFDGDYRESRGKGYYARCVSAAPDVKR